MSTTLESQLQQFLARRVPGARINEFSFLVSGFESDIYTFRWLHPDGYTQSLVLRIYSDDSAAQKLQREANGVRLLATAGFPVAAILNAETDPSILGKPFSVMERLQGKPLWPWLYQLPPAQVDELLDRFGGIIARLHALDWRPFTGRTSAYASEPALAIDELLMSMRDLYIQHHVPGFNTIVDWLGEHMADIQPRLSVVHLDFHANNVFLCEDGRMAVIDWTQISVNDYRCD